MTVTRQSYEALDSGLKERLNSSSLFASESFCNLFKTLGGEPVCFLLEVDNNIVALFPGVEFGRGKFKRFQAMPDGCYANLIHTEQDVPVNDSVAGVLLSAIKSAGYLKSFIFDYHCHFAQDTNIKATACTTQLVDISTDWQPPDKKLLSEIRKAEKEGIEVVSYDKARHSDQFYELVKSTAHRHGKGAWYPPEFYDALADLADADSRVDWKIVLHQEKLAASHINFRIRNTLVNWQVHFDKEYSFLKPNQYLLYRAAIEAAQGGATILNLGASPDSAASLEVYKRKWGGREYHYRCLEIRSLLGKLF